MSGCASGLERLYDLMLGPKATTLLLEVKRTGTEMETRMQLAKLQAEPKHQLLLVGPELPIKLAPLDHRLSSLPPLSSPSFTCPPILLNSVIPPSHRLLGDVPPHLEEPRLEFRRSSYYRSFCGS